MKNHKTIEDIFISWGQGKREKPANNDILKNEILAKIPVSRAEIGIPVRSSFPWLSFAFTAMAVLVFLVSNISQPLFTNNKVLNTQAGVSESSSYDSYSMPMYRRINSSISDKREFLKVGYNATLRTRDVADSANTIATIVRGFSGRVDELNSGEKYGYVSFVVPKESWETFRAEIKKIASAKFYVERVNYENLLPQKQTIEESKRQVEKNLNNLKNLRTQTIETHDQNIILYQNRTGITNEEKIKLINDENDAYQVKINNINNQIKNAQNNLDAVQKQNTDLLDNIATVNGSISLSWISLFEMADMYIPGPLIAWMLLGVAIIAYLWHRRSVKIFYNYL